MSPQTASAIPVLLVFGTRPEAIKMAPVVHALRHSVDFAPSVCVTGQHREMLRQVLDVFDIEPDHDLDIQVQRQTLSDVTTRALAGLSEVLEEVRPAAVLVQGDTTTSFVAALAAFYAKIPVVHLEAGLRTDDRWSPFPEEINRRMTTALASLHLAPTPSSRENLLRENVAAENVVVTGNTVIDALLWTVQRDAPFADPDLEKLETDDHPVVLVTAHRRESWGEGMRSIGRAVATLATDHPDTTFVLPAHRNPVVRETLLPLLRGRENVWIVDPLPYGDFCRLLRRASVLLTDSGGVQEEGPSLGKPVLVLRDVTERPEAIVAGTARLLGTDECRIVDEVTRLLEDEAAYAAMSNAVNPYGDGQAAARTLAALRQFFDRGERLPDFGS